MCEDKAIASFLGGKKCIEMRSEKTGLREFQPGLVQTGLYSHRRRLEEIPCAENKGADQLCNYCTADLRLCFLHMLIVCFLVWQLKYF